MPSLLNKCEGIENNSNYHTEEAGINTIDKEIDMPKRTNEILDK